VKEIFTCLLLLVSLSVQGQKNDLKKEAEKHWNSAWELLARSNYEHSSQEFLYAGKQFLALADQVNSGVLRTDYQNRYFKCMIGILDNQLVMERYQRVLVLADVLQKKAERYADAGNILFELQLIQAKAFLGKEDYPNASEILKKAQTTVLQYKDSPESAKSKVNHLWGKFYAQQEQWSKALDAYNQALTILPASATASHTIRFYILRDQSLAYARLGDINAAKARLRESEQLAETHFSRKSLIWAEYLLRKSEILQLDYQADSSLYYANQSVKSFLDYGAVNDPQLSEAHLIAFRLNLEAGKKNDAHDHLKKLTQIRSFVYGASHLKLGEAYLMGAEYYLANRDYGKAKADLDRTYNLLTQNIRTDSVAYLRTYLLYADWFTHQNKNQEARYALGKAKDYGLNISSLSLKYPNLVWDYYQRQFTAIMSVHNYTQAQSILTDAEKNLSTNRYYAPRLLWLKTVLETATASQPAFTPLTLTNFPQERAESGKVQALDRLRKLKNQRLF